MPARSSLDADRVLLKSAVLAALLAVVPPTVHEARGQAPETARPDSLVPLAAPTARADSALEARLTAAFGQIDSFENVNVDVNSGVVRLTGTVLQPDDAAQAEALASQVEGVFHVVNDLETETSVGTRLVPALERIETSAQEAVAWLPLAGIALLVVLIFWGASLLVGRWEHPPKRLALSPLLWQLLRGVARVAILLTGLLLAFDLLGVTSLVGAVLGTAGVAGLAIGFAFQDIIENYLAGALLSIQQPFTVNDVVEVEEQEGRVVRMTARELVLLTFEGNHVRLPNATVFKNPTTNYTRNPRRLFSFDVGVGSLEDLTEVARIGRETLEAMNGVLSDPPPFVRVQDLGDSFVTVRVHGWVHQSETDIGKVRSEAIRLVKTALEDAGIDMPEPTYRLQVWQQEAPSPEGPETTKRKETPKPSALEEARSIDVTPDGKLEAQVYEDLARSDDPNLLTEGEDNG